MIIDIQQYQIDFLIEQLKEKYNNINDLNEELRLLAIELDKLIEGN